ERRVGAPVDDEAARPGLGRGLAMAPNIGEAREVGVLVPLAARIVPEADRHRRERPSADELALGSENAAAVVIPDFDGHAEARALNLAANDGRPGIAEHEKQERT